MIKNRNDKEINLVNDLRKVEKGDICCIPETIKANRVVNDVIFNDKWEEKWKDNSEDTNNPPDFYSDKLSIMMDVMRVTDKEVKSGKNPTLAKESKVLKEIEESGILKLFPNITEDNILLNCNSDLSSDEDHNFKAYKRQFKRTIEKHAKKVETYKKNHPDIKRVVFYIHDDSTFYVIPDVPREKYRVGEIVKVKSEGLHIWFIDKYFVDLIINSGADYVIWYAPCKSSCRSVAFTAEEDTQSIKLPKVVVFDCKKIKNEFDLREYDEDLMISLEQ